MALGRVAPTDAKREERLEQAVQRPVDVADELDRRTVVRVDLGRLGVDVDERLRAVRVPAARGVLDEVVADRDDEVGPVEPGHDVVAGLQPDGHQRQVRAVVDRALAHERDGDRDVEALRERPERLRRLPPEDAVSGEHDRPVGIGDDPGRVGDRVLRRLGQVGPRRLERARRVAGLGRHRGEVLGQLDVGRPGLLELGHPERLADDLGDRVDPRDPGVPLRHRPEHPDDVDELVGLLVELVRADLAGDRDERGPVEVGVGDAGDEVRRAGAEGRHRDGGLAGQPSVDVGHEGRALLVTGRDMADPVRPAERVEDVHRLLARDREDVAAALGLEALDEEVGGGPRTSRGIRHGRECTPGPPSGYDPSPDRGGTWSAGLPARSDS